MNHNVYEQLCKVFDINLIQKIDPPVSFPAKVISKGKRTLGLRGSFPSFTGERLVRIKKVVESKLDSSANLNFFHGSTPWLKVDSLIPYALYLDCCFASYIRVYHNHDQFSRLQLGSLFKKEKKFLTNARAVFFSSDWALRDAVESVTR